MVTGLGTDRSHPHLLLIPYPHIPRMFSTLSSLLPPAFQSNAQEKDKPPLKPSPEDISPPQPAMAVDEQGVYKKKRDKTHEVGTCSSCLPSESQ